ncbi:hypothetical protein HN873_013027, partial [Arachis hypogaea]
MLETGAKPNAVSLTSVLLGCSNLSALQLGRQVHQLVCKSPLSSKPELHWLACIPNAGGAEGRMEI